MGGWSDVRRRYARRREPVDEFEESSKRGEKQPGGPLQGGTNPGRKRGLLYIPIIPR